MSRDAGDALVLAGEFPPVDRARWRAAVDRSLSRDATTMSPEARDALFTKKLVTTTYDGLAIQPLYTRADAPDLPLGVPGAPPFVRGATVAGATTGGWDARARVPLLGDGAPTAVRALAELEGGATSLLLETASHAASPELLDRALAGVYLELAPIAFDAGAAAGEWGQALLTLWSRRGIHPSAARGSFGIDPLGDAARTGAWRGVEPALQAGVTMAMRCTGRFPGVRPLRIDATPYHEAGASDVEELACALATGVAYLRRLVDAGIAVDAALDLVELRVAATADQFLTIAKLRALRRCWDRIAAVAGAGAARRGPALHAQASRAMLTRYDPWVNMLRASVACFAAAVGGATAISLDPFDTRMRAEPSPLGVRMARNTQAILAEESYVGRVLDPAGGSWYVESLTAAVAAHAWDWLREIEAAGGMAAALAAGLVQARIAATRGRREQNLARRREAVTGVSEFPNVLEDVPPPFAPAVAEAPGALPVFHRADAYERLREAADAAARAGTRPQVFLATLGPLAEHTPRLNFAKNLFEAGGIAAVGAGTVDADGVAARFVESGAALACVCGNDERYAAEAEAVVGALRAAGPRRLYVAGSVDRLRETLTAAGVDEYVVLGCDAVDLLTRALGAALPPQE
ncbi:MAG: methylmalonyl-CoA mutase [bacterium]|nr:methylmalonyl-CoA mutase [bacterium]